MRELLQVRFGEIHLKGQNRPYFMRMLVERVRDNADRRVVKVHLLPAGESKIAALHTSFQHYAAAWADKLSRSEAKELSNALGTLIRVMANVSDEQA